MWHRSAPQLCRPVTVGTAGSHSSSLSVTEPAAPAEGCALPGGILMFGALVLESEFVHVVAISFTALVLTELLMVALTVRTWHWLMVVLQLLQPQAATWLRRFSMSIFGKLPCICLLNNCLFLVFKHDFLCCFCDMIFSADCRPLHSAQLTLQGDEPESL